MHYLDIIILVVVVLFLAAIIYFRWIKKRPEGGCHCYRAKNCNLKLDELKNITFYTKE